MMSHNTRLNLRAKLVPLPDLKIELRANRIFARNASEFLIYNSSKGWDSYNNSFGGNFSMSVITLGTSFEKLGKAFVQDSKGWNDMQNNRQAIEIMTRGAESAYLSLRYPEKRGENNCSNSTGELFQFQFPDRKWPVCRL